MRTGFRAAVALGAALIALCAAGAAQAQDGPSLQETTRYILERCDGHSYRFDGQAEVTRMTISGDQLSVSAGGGNARSIPIRRVVFATEPPMPGSALDQTNISATCLSGYEGCLGGNRSTTWFVCRTPDNVWRALNRLQALLGGPLNDDPFAS